jgi:hypothetical protein
MAIAMRRYCAKKSLTKTKEDNILGLLKEGVYEI